MTRPPDLPAHDPCGPSSLGRLIACPASWRLSWNEPETTRDYAKEGDFLHNALYLWRDRGELPPGISEDNKDLLYDCDEFVEKVLAGRKVIHQFLEERVELLDDDDTVVNYGTLDLMLVTSDCLFLFDWKFGRIVHRHSLVLQLANYAVAACQTLLRAGESYPGKLEAYAYFPRLAKSFQFYAPDVTDIVDDVREKVWQIIERAQDDKSEAIPGPWCDYCRHLPNCKVVKQTTKALSAHVDTLLAVPGKVAEVYDIGNLAVKQFDALKTRIREILAERPDALPGLELREVNGRRRVMDLERLREEVLRHCFFTEPEFDDLIEKTVRPVALEESFLRKHYTGREGPTKKALRKRLAEVAGDTIYQAREKRLRRTEDGRESAGGAIQGGAGTGNQDASAPGSA